VSEERVMIDIKVNHAQRSGYFVRCQQLKHAIERIENNSDSKVIGLVYDGENSIELLLDPPINKGDDEE
tara:strand:- start:29039 stop:29245 length:207 start_codon:yes stop_codon:yes gene_type:complete